MLKRLGSLYGVDVQDLLQRAGFLEDPDGVAARDDEPQEVERAYQYVLADPKFRVGTRPSGPLFPGGQAVHRGDVRTLHRKTAVGMNMVRTLDDFCDELMRDDSLSQRLEPERLAGGLPPLLRTVGPSHAG